MESGIEYENIRSFSPEIARAIAERLYGILEDGEIRSGFNEYASHNVRPMSPATLIQVRKSLIKAGTHIVEAFRNYEVWGFDGFYARTERHIESLPSPGRVHDGQHVATAWETRGRTVPSFVEPRKRNQSTPEWQRVNDNEERCTWAWQGFHAENRLDPKNPVVYSRRTADDFVAVIEKIPEIEDLYGSKA